jgi:hypothetical protein
MKIMTQVKRKRSPRRERPPYRTLEGWALGLLVETHTIRECDHHGHMRDKADPDAWNHARELAAAQPFPGATKRDALKAIDDVMGTIGDTCPECDGE